MGRDGTGIGVMAGHPSPTLRSTALVEKSDDRRTLTDADVRALAEAMVEILDARETAATKRWLTAAEVATLTGRSRAWCYENRDLLGGVPLPTGGSRPRLQFDRERVEQALATGSTSRRSLIAEARSTSDGTGRRSRRAKGTKGRLLPIHGQGEAA